MNIRFAVMVTDEINRLNYRIPADVLAKGLEEHLLSSISSGLPPGTPMHLAHDLHRPLGWSTQLGILVAGKVAAAVGYVQFFETEREVSALEEIRSRYFDDLNERANAPIKDAFLEGLRGEGVDLAGASFCEPGVLRRSGIARDLFPSLFDVSSASVDRDGLVGYRQLCRELKPRGAGAFLDERRKLVFYAHRYFRRSLSHRNHLNPYFLDSFHRASQESEQLELRLRLDPDIVGYASAVSDRMEFEYWHGPRFKRDINAIKVGVAVHKAELQTQVVEAIDELHVWWKAPEEREVEGEVRLLRTLEMEELPSEASAGEGENFFACRYIHSEFDPSMDAITHFDGAIRGYRGEAFETRKATQMNRAGKHAEYTKLFRIDGPLEVSKWQTMCGSYLRGNPLLSEYFGVESEGEPTVNGAPEAPLGERPSDPLIALVAYIAQRLSVEAPTVSVDRFRKDDENLIPVIEWCEEAHLCRLVGDVCDLSGLTKIVAKGTALNLPRIVLPPDQVLLKEILDRLVDALKKDLDSSAIDQVSLAIAWPWETVTISLALAGTTPAVLGALLVLRDVVDVSLPPSSWMAGLKCAAEQGSAPPGALHELGTRVDATGMLSVPFDGV